MLFVGDDWAEGHHDIEVMDVEGIVRHVGRVVEGAAGLDEVGEVFAGLLDADEDPDQVVIAIETDHGTWVQALVAAGYLVFAVDPKQAKRHKEMLVKSGRKDDKTDAHSLADMARVRRHQLHRLGDDSALASAVKVLARDQQRAVWDRTRYSNRLRAALLMYFPAILTLCREVDLGLSSRPVLALLSAAPTPAQGAALSVEEITRWLTGYRRKTDRAEAIAQILHRPQLPVDPELVSSYAASVRSSIAFVQVATEQANVLKESMNAHFERHPDADIYLSQPGIGAVLGPRLLGEFGDDLTRFRSAKARKNAAQTSPLTIQSGKRRTVIARRFGNDRLLDAALGQAECAMLNDAHARAYYDKQRARGVEHSAALRQLANKLIGILHGCLVHGEPYNPSKAWKPDTIAEAA